MGGQKEWEGERIGRAVRVGVREEWTVGCFYNERNAYSVALWYSDASLHVEDTHQKEVVLH